MVSSRHYLGVTINTDLSSSVYTNDIVRKALTVHIFFNCVTICPSLSQRKLNVWRNMLQWCS